LNIQIDKREIIPLSDFELGWRFDKGHNSDISDYDKKEIFALSENESKRLNKVIGHYEVESNRIGKYLETDWFSANSENDDKVERFRNQVENYLKPFNEDIIISWERKLTLKTTKNIFIKYWTDFLYPSSDDVTIISEKTNWILFYNHCEVANIWIKNQL
jgi:predicted ATP-grasp superfamily ATP-dependent carboligase